MKEVTPFDLTLSYVALLLEEQRYEEALPILGSLMEMDPSDREARMYRLLLLRILVQQYYLSNPEIKAGARAASVCAALAQKARVGLSLCSARIPRSLARSPSGPTGLRLNPAFARGTAAALACVLLAMPFAFAVFRRSVAHEPAIIDRSTPPLSAVDVSAFRPTTPVSVDTARDSGKIAGVDVESGLTSGFEPWGVEPHDSSAVARVGYPVRTERWIRVDSRSSKRQPPAKTVAKQNPQQPGGQAGLHYESQRDLALRRSASFAAAVVQEIARGTPLK
ncbi:MAG TPA: hypothetical protein VNO43_10195, partial [Candidatus Eisenbacteria bacterium]|nr:hypothetical protein [Candidatus Eisenbacteria bacterium]